MYINIVYFIFHMCSLDPLLRRPDLHRIAQFTGKPSYHFSALFV